MDPRFAASYWISGSFLFYGVRRDCTRFANAIRIHWILLTTKAGTLFVIGSLDITDFDKTKSTNTCDFSEMGPSAGSKRRNEIRRHHLGGKE